MMDDFKVIKEKLYFTVDMERKCGNVKLIYDSKFAKSALLCSPEMGLG
jgi:hypothetical protein